MRERLKENPNTVDDALAKIAAELEARPAYVYANRGKGFTWEGTPDHDHWAPPADLSETGELPVPDSVRGVDVGVHATKH
jgi:hypothetical protein